MFQMALLIIILPLSLFFWTIHTIFRVYYSQNDIMETIPLFRWLTAFLIPLFIASYGLRKRSLSMSGAIAGLFVGFVLTLSSYCFMASLLTFFISGSLASKYRSKQKKLMEDDYKEGGQRNWVQVLCNGGIAAHIALIYMVEGGCGEWPIDFSKRYNVSWLTIAVVSQLASCCGDTLASEIGSVTGSSLPRLILDFSAVPRGTNGGLSLNGVISSIIGGLLVGLAYYLTLVMIVSNGYFANSPSQWPIILTGAIAGFIGSTLDSFLGALFQYSGYDIKRGCIVSTPGTDIRHISGKAILDNHSVNLLSALFTTFLTPSIAIAIWRWII